LHKANYDNLGLKDDVAFDWGKKIILWSKKSWWDFAAEISVIITLMSKLYIAKKGKNYIFNMIHV
jgi:hypothetical protein